MAYRRSGSGRSSSRGRSTRTRAARAYSGGRGRRAAQRGRAGALNTLRLVIETAPASGVSRNQQVLAKMNPPPKSAKF